MHKAYNDRLPAVLSNGISKKHDIRARDSLLVPRFNRRYMKDSVAYRGSVLWNMLTSKYIDLVDEAQPRKLVKKLKCSNVFNDFNFNVTSAALPLALNEKTRRFFIYLM